MECNKIDARSFYLAALSFCREIAALCAELPIDYEEIQLQLITIYSLGLQLQSVETESDEAVVRVNERIQTNFGALDNYWEVWDAYRNEEPVLGMLSDDISDIRNDLMTGCLLYAQGKEESALWQWRFDFRHHWSRHAVDAIRAVNQLIES
ncbi:MAG: DUF5063 domain-containing protein [Oscillospiraceae bacterium]|nr:DUF5063 domain-containing protein [Oscillospiraceae bacterium]